MIFKKLVCKMIVITYLTNVRYSKQKFSIYQEFKTTKKFIKNPK